MEDRGQRMEDIRRRTEIEDETEEDERKIYTNSPSEISQPRQPPSPHIYTIMLCLVPYCTV